jgi:hypothetical protein
MNAPAASAERTAFQRHPLLSLALGYAAWLLCTFAILAFARGTSVFASPRFLLVSMPCVGALLIAGLLCHLRVTMPPSRLERFGRIFGGTIILVFLWFVLVYLYIITHASGFL